MKYALALVVSLIASGYATASAPDAPDDASVVATDEQAATPAPASAALNPIPLLLIEGDDHKIPFREQNEVPVRAVPVEEIQMIASHYAEGGLATTIVIDASHVLQQAYLHKPTVSNAVRQVGVEQQPNPAYQRAQQRVNDAEQALRRAQTSNDVTQDKAREVMALSEHRATTALGGLLAIASNNNVVHLKRRLEAARRELASVQATVSTPAFVNEPHAEATEVVKASGYLVAYVIESAGDTARSVRIPINQVSTRVYVPQAGQTYAANAARVSLPEVSVEHIVQQAVAAPVMTLAEMADELTAGRERSAEAASASEQRAAETTAHTLARLAAMAPAGAVDNAKDDVAEAETEPEADDNAAAAPEADGKADAAPEADAGVATDTPDALTDADSDADADADGEVEGAADADTSDGQPAGPPQR